ncbi:MAG: osmotically inducible protein C, partial [Phototrophicales bacterium]
RKGWPVDTVEVHTSYGKDYAKDCGNCKTDGAKIDTFERLITLTGELDDKQRQRIKEIADKCPVHRTLHSETQVITQLLEG